MSSQHQQQQQQQHQPPTSLPIWYTLGRSLALNHPASSREAFVAFKNSINTTGKTDIEEFC